MSNNRGNTPILDGATLPIALLDMGENFYASRQANTADLYRRAQFSQEQIERQNQHMSDWQFRELIRCCRDIAMPGKPLSVQMADFIPITVPGGMFGLASFTAKSVQQSLEVMVSFSPTVMPTYRFELINDGCKCHVIPHCKTDFGDVQHQLNEAVCGYILNLRHFAKLPDPKPTVQLTHEPMGNVSDYENTFGANFIFSQKMVCITFEKHHLSQPLYTHNRATFEQVYANLKSTSEIAKNLTNSKKVTDALRSRIARLQPISSTQIAEHMNVSERTLARRLHQEGTSFAELKQQVCIDYAKYLLSGSELPVCKVAHACGYSSDSNFARAFKSVTGLTPKEFRALN